MCDRGFKGQSMHGAVVRGFDGLQAVTVWVDSGMDCDVQCDSLSCAEVEQVGPCFGKLPTEGFGTLPIPVGVEGTDDVETASVGGGAVKVPGADVGGDYVQGVADPALVGEAT